MTLHLLFPCHLHQQPHAVEQLLATNINPWRHWGRILKLPKEFIERWCCFYYCFLIPGTNDPSEAEGVAEHRTIPSVWACPERPVGIATVFMTTCFGGRSLRRGAGVLSPCSSPASPTTRGLKLCGGKDVQRLPVPWSPVFRSEHSACYSSSPAFAIEEIDFQFPPRCPQFSPTQHPQCPAPLPYCTKEGREDLNKGNSRWQESGHPWCRFWGCQFSEGKSCSGRTESAQVTHQLSRSDVLPPPLAPPAGVHSSCLSAGVSRISCHQEKQKQALLNVEFITFYNSRQLTAQILQEMGGKPDTVIFLLKINIKLAPLGSTQKIITESDRS